MKAMLLNKLSRLEENHSPLEMADLPEPLPNEHEILVKVSTCGVCHTELDEIEGRTPPPQMPVILGHQVVGRVAAAGRAASRFRTAPTRCAAPTRQVGERVGVAWIHSACGKCSHCLEGNENLCPEFSATGRDVNGGYAEYMTVAEDFCYPIPPIFSDAEAAPLLCAGAIGYRSLRLTGLNNGQSLGLTGFGASAHLVLMMVKFRFPNSRVYVFSRSEGERTFARELGAVWAGDTDEEAPEKLSAIIDTTPVWKPVVEALENLEPGGRLVVNAIRKEDVDKNYLLHLDYPTHLWMEKEIKTVANVARSDVREFLELAAEIPIRPEFQEFDLTDANQALFELKSRKIRGAKVLRVAR
jgi:propanol-preferring alcohol dehydrogenase